MTALADLGPILDRAAKLFLAAGLHDPAAWREVAQRHGVTRETIPAGAAGGLYQLVFDELASCNGSADLDGIRTRAAAANIPLVQTPDAENGMAPNALDSLSLAVPEHTATPDCLDKLATGLAYAADRCNHARELLRERADCRGRIGVIDAELTSLQLESAPNIGPQLVCMGDIEPVPVKWLWPGLIPMGRITLLVGRPGEGKSFLTIFMAARVSTGSPWPEGAACPKGCAILISAEDDPADTIRPRLDAHHADVSRIHVLSAVRYVGRSNETREVIFTLRDVASLEEALRRVPACRLVVIDPIGSFLGADVDGHRDNEVRGVLAPVARLAQQTGAAVVVVAHRRKMGGTFADDLAIGSRAFTGIARSVLHVCRDPNKKARRLLLPGKCNIAAEGEGLAFTIGGEPPAIAWERDRVRMSADDGLAAESLNQERRRGPKPQARNAAVVWLRRLLADGPVAATTVEAEVKGARLSWPTVRRAADELQIVSEKTGFAAGWVWRLPDPPTKVLTEDAQVPQREENLSNLDTFDKSPWKTNDSERQSTEDAQVSPLEQLGATKPPITHRASESASPPQPKEPTPPQGSNGHGEAMTPAVHSTLPSANLEAGATDGQTCGVGHDGQEYLTGDLSPSQVEASGRLGRR